MSISAINAAIKDKACFFISINSFHQGILSKPANYIIIRQSLTGQALAGIGFEYPENPGFRFIGLTQIFGAAFNIHDTRTTAAIAPARIFLLNRGRPRRGSY
jgi:hypothetical protein